MPDTGLWRVYAPVWVVAYVSDADGNAGFTEAQQAMDDRWAGRVRTEDMAAIPPSGGGRSAVALHRPALHGEWRDRELADGQGSRLEGGLVVRAGSDQERELTDFGRRRLRA